MLTLYFGAIEIRSNSCYCNYFICFQRSGMLTCFSCFILLISWNSSQVISTLQDLLTMKGTNGGSSKLYLVTTGEARNKSSNDRNPSLDYEINLVDQTCTHQSDCSKDCKLCDGAYPGFEECLCQDGTCIRKSSKV